MQRRLQLTLVALLLCSGCKRPEAISAAGKQTFYFADGGWAGSEQIDTLPSGAPYMRYRKSPAPDEMIRTLVEEWIDGGWVLQDEKLSSRRRPPLERGP